MRLTPNKLGNYTVVCTELCGLGHSTMRSPVHVVNAQQFNAWFRQQVKPTAAQAPSGGGGGGGAASTAQGKQLFQANGCGGCHTLADAGANGTVGPNLNNIDADAAKFGKQLGQSPQQYIFDSIKTPTKFTVPGFPKGVMPSTFGQQLSPQQINALVKYLQSVGKG
jgi:cytochrome c oxidase subunit 2